MMTGVCENMKPLWKVKGFFDRTLWKVSDVQIVRSKTWVLSSFSVSVSVSLSLCVSVSCVSVSLCVVVVVVVEGGRGRREGGGEGRRLIESSGPKFPSRLLKLNSLFFYPVADSLRSVPQENWS